MVPGYNDLILVWLSRQQCELGLDFGEGTPDAEIAGVKEEVAGRDCWTCAVCVGYADDGDRLRGERRLGRGPMKGYQSRSKGAKMMLPKLDFPRLWFRSRRI